MCDMKVIGKILKTVSRLQGGGTDGRTDGRTHARTDGADFKVPLELRSAGDNNEIISSLQVFSDY